MPRRLVSFILSLGVLCSVGSAFRRPCCPLIELARQAPALSADCCQDPICCDTEKNGPAPAALTAHACSARTLAAITIVPVHPAILTACLVAPVPGQAHLAFDHSPLDSARSPQALLSTFRI